MAARKRKTFKDDAILFLSFLVTSLSKVSHSKEYATLVKIREGARALIEKKENLSSLRNLQLFVGLVAKIKVFAEGGFLNGIVRKDDQARIIHFCEDFQMRLRLNHEGGKKEFSSKKKRMKRNLVRT